MDAKDVEQCIMGYRLVSCFWVHLQQSQSQWPGGKIRDSYYVHMDIRSLLCVLHTNSPLTHGPGEGSLDRVSGLVEVVAIQAQAGF